MIIVISILMLAWLLLTYNSLVTRKNKVKQAKSSMDVYLTQRFDLIPNLVECVKGYMMHEQKVFEKMNRLKNDYTKTKDLKAGATLNTMCNHMLGMAENYPKLQASEQFLELQKSLSKMESQLQAARRIYNSEVTVYNTQIATIPTKLLARLLGFKEIELFEEQIEAKQNIHIQ